jgi:hypothetical protein
MSIAFFKEIPRNKGRQYYLGVSFNKFIMNGLTFERNERYAFEGHLYVSCFKFCLQSSQHGVNNNSILFTV